jgi:quercetin dioxygenase-like cupin family protein
MLRKPEAKVEGVVDSDGVRIHYQAAEISWLSLSRPKGGRAMAIISELRYRPCDDAQGDPDDYRPRSSWAAAVDPGDGSGTRVEDQCVIVDVVAPGDRLPLHTHPVSELFVLEKGEVEITLGSELSTISAGAVVFAPAQVPHGARNIGDGEARFIGVFPTERVGIHYLERNPAPGTEGDPPQPLVEFDVRAEVEAGWG